MINFFFGTLGEVTAYITKINNAVTGYPSPDLKTLRYSLPQVHWGKLNGGGQPTEYLMPVKEAYSPMMERQGTFTDIDNASTVAERTTKRKTWETLDLEGAFAWPPDSGSQ